MIVFCEDCGAKNDIRQGQLAGGKAVFTCISCSYANRYALKSEPISYGNKADKLLAKIDSIPDIIGTFIYHSESGILRSDMPEQLNPDDLQPLGRILWDNFSHGLSGFDDTILMTLFIPNRNLVVKPIDTQALLIVICRTNQTVKSVSGVLKNV